MRNFKKAIVFVLTIFTIIPMSAKAAAADFGDTAGHWAENTIGLWADNGVLSGAYGNFMPDAPITRAEMAAVLNRVIGYNETPSNQFSDVAESDWFYADILKLNLAGVMYGSKGKASPNDNITREEAAVLIARAFDVTEGECNFPDTENISDWASSLVGGMKTRGYLNGDTNGNFNPKANITRAEAVTVINNIVSAFYQKADEYTSAVSGNAVIKTPAVTLKNMKINGNLYIMEGVGEGGTTLDNVTVTGKTYVRGGGENSVIIRGASKIGEIWVSKGESGTVRINITDASVDAVHVINNRDGVIIDGNITSAVIESAGNVRFKNNSTEEVTVAETAKEASVTVEKTAKVTVLTIKAANTEADIFGKVSKTNVTGNKTSLTVQAGASAENITLSGAVGAIYVSGTVKSINITGDGANIQTNTGAKITEVTVNANNTSISGSAPAGTVKVESGNGTSVTTGGTNIVVSSDAGNISTDSNAAQPGNGGGGTGGSVSGVKINIGSISGVTTPSYGQTPVTTITGTSQYTGTVTWNPTVSGTFAANTVYTATINLTPKPGYTLSGVGANFFAVSGAATTNGVNSGVVKAVFPETVYKTNVNNINELNEAVNEVTSGGVICLTPEFYEDANSDGNFITIGASASHNDAPYTIQGTGNSNELTVGILIANDNITLKDVTLALSSRNRAPDIVWTSGSSYHAAIAVSYTAGSATPNASSGGCRGVQIKDNLISFNADTGMTAGVFMCGSSPDAVISGNAISVDVRSAHAAQALAVGIYDTSIAITGNTLSASNSGTPNGIWNRPASAIYIGKVHEKPGNEAINISNNILSFTPYSFYFNAYPPESVPAAAAGVDALRNDGFSTNETVWALSDSTDLNSVHKRLLSALADNISDTGFGFVGELVLYSGSNAFEVEQYEISNKQIEAVSYFGDSISNNVYDFKTTHYGRKSTLDSPDGDDHFHWIYGTADTDYNPNN